MKRELALQILQAILPNLTDEAAASTLFRELQFLADYKYNTYEMYHPARLFLENLALWLSQFDEGERAGAVEFVKKELVFISRKEFQQLASVMYHDRIVVRQVALAASLSGIPNFMIRKVKETPDSNEYHVLPCLLA